jgi:hypothetical protein
MQSFFVEMRGKAERKKKGAKKKETDGQWETGAADGKSAADSHSGLESKNRFPTLNRRTFGPKNREHFIDDPKVYNVTQVIGAEYAAAQKRTRDLLWEARRSVF